jgi:hypothetical protein
MKSFENFVALKNIIQQNKCFAIVGRVEMCKFYNQIQLYFQKWNFASKTAHEHENAEEK